ncbi:MAG: Carbonic anhydrase, gamma class [uncultured Thermomicrobiales bacterium]|uniref:Carbonic anhydrase, gamma class n=1 Tax=uncultured Thermomicrobiales bacterium TaxID=1645740 RepID=A0A6J4VPH7_9BACT|nr:MAG: Carbonic anhydrase, gamma class [uncultured Thermomicrobiales bacterium]
MALILPYGDKVPQVAPDAYLAPNATLIGDVTIGPEASVWFGAVLRGDDEAIIIGARSNVQDNAVVHADTGFPTIVGEEVTIGHGAIVHGARVGDGALIGMGTTLLNGATIGAESVVGANALVSEGKEFPARSLILGVPGKLARELDADAATHGRTGAAHYVARGKRYARASVVGSP